MGAWGKLIGWLGKSGKVSKTASAAGSSTKEAWSKGFADGVKYASAKVGTAAKTVAKTAEPVAVAAGKAGTRILTWGNAAKAAVVAFGATVAYKWFGSGIPAFFADVFNTSEQNGSYIAIACFAALFLVLISCIRAWFRGKGADFGEGKRRARKISGKKRRRKSGRPSR
ncbi:hypothetical protein TALC_00409 [Thermoplasmatales archaeon BRNA1]|nr:hypothetical protein TALC_00409 [Thermoplasmatales archaeon BRNA1]